MNDYFSEEGLNYSTLSMVDSNNIAQVFDPEKRRQFDSLAMDKGSLVDCLLTDPERFDDDFIISDTRVEVSDTMSKIMKGLIDNDMEFERDSILRIAQDIGYGGNWKDDTIINKVYTPENRQYYAYLELKKSGKTIVTTAYYNQALQVIEVLKTHGFTHHIFEPEEGKEILYQVPIFWEELAYNGEMIRCKALLDIVVIDHNKKVIYPIDLKIKSDSKFSFVKGFISFKYYLQASWYTQGITRYAISRNLYGEYKIANFTFVVTNFDYPDPPIMYYCTHNDLRVGRNGGRLRSNDQEVKGTQQLFNDYVWYKETGNTQMPRDLQENSGHVNINAFKPK